MTTFAHIAGNILELVLALHNEGHTAGIAPNREASGNSHTTYDIRVSVRTPKEAGNVAAIEYRATSSYGLGFSFLRKNVTPAFSSEKIILDDFGSELDVSAVVADANAVRDMHTSLRGVEYKERAERTVKESPLMASAAVS